MELKSVFLLNDKEIIKKVLDKINFYSRVVEMKKTYVYELNGVFLGKMYDLQSKKKKIEVIEVLLTERKIKYKLSKKDRLFEICNSHNGFSYQLNIGYDETALGGAFGIHSGHNCNNKELLWGRMFDLILMEFYGYEITRYRFCTIDEGAIIAIADKILNLYFDFVEMFKNQLDNLSNG